ncbi:MAG: tetratricopeptide repeat protein [Planctomycetes bacterium]|nr:tetratricopeptide repeat protein [Planctomycetota bacterium]
MFKQDDTPETFMQRPMPPRYRLAAGMARRAFALLDQSAGKPRDTARADKLLAGISISLDDSSDIEGLDDALERAVDAIAADPDHVGALTAAAKALMLHGHFEDWVYHPRPLRDAKRLLGRARDLAPHNDDVLEAILRCELLLRRFDQAADILDQIKAEGRAPFAHAMGRAIWFDLHDNFKQAEDWYGQAVKAARETEQRAWALVHHARCLANLGDLERADSLMAQGVIGGAPHRQRLIYWSNLKFHRKRYDEAWELNRRALCFGPYDEAMRARHFLLGYFRRLTFIPKQPFTLPEEKSMSGDGAKAPAQPKYVCGDLDLGVDTDDEFVPPFRVDLFIQGEHLPVVSDIADPGASFEGRARLLTRYLDPRTLEKQPLVPGSRFRTGQYVFLDERSGAVYQALVVRRKEKRNPYREMPAEDRKFFRLDDKAMEQFDSAPWDVALYITKHGFDPLMGVLNFCKLCDSFLRHAGGIGVDLETGMTVHGGDWRNEGPQAFEISKHVVIHAEETSPGNFWLHTHGLCKFLRPELEIRELPARLVEGAWAQLMDAAAQAALGAVLREGDVVGNDKQPLVLRRGMRKAGVHIKHNLRPSLEIVDVGNGDAPEHGAQRGIESLLGDKKK